MVKIHQAGGGKPRKGFLPAATRPRIRNPLFMHLLHAQRVPFQQRAKVRPDVQIRLDAISPGWPLPYFPSPPPSAAPCTLDSGGPRRDFGRLLLQPGHGLGFGREQGRMVGLGGGKSVVHGRSHDGIVAQLVEA